MQIKINKDDAQKTERLIKSFLALKGMSLTDLAKLINEETDKSESVQSLSQKLKRGTIKYVEMEKIAQLLGYEITWVNK